MRIPAAAADELANRILLRCLDEGTLAPASDEGLPDWTAYRRFRDRVRASFQVPTSAITPLMARVLYGIAFISRPLRILGIGTYLGNGLVWLAGPGSGSEAAYRLERAVAVDIDREATELAQRNFDALALQPGVECLAQDGHEVANALAETWDLVWLDAEDPVRGKGIYLTLLESIYPWIRPGGLIVAHDICVPKFKEDIERYHARVLDGRRFSATVPLAIDASGIEVSLKATGALTAPAKEQDLAAPRTR